jgi:hypothetical protein
MGCGGVVAYVVAGITEQTPGLARQEPRRHDERDVVVSILSSLVPEANIRDSEVSDREERQRQISLSSVCP